MEDEFDKLIEEKIKKDHNLPVETKFDSKSTKDDLYDENIDDEDEEFVQSLNVSNRFSDSKVKSNYQSDATLNCPCCMSLLSLETQRHVSYKNQYRAMFTFNTKIDKENPVEPINKTNKKRKKSKNQWTNIVESNDDLIFYPVSCSHCSTEVAVVDSEEVYHFYNTLASY